MVIVSPPSRVVPRTNDLILAYKWRLLTGMILQLLGRYPKFGDEHILLDMTGPASCLFARIYG